MMQLRFKMDPSNPGHYYACCGLLEIASLYSRNIESFFALTPGSVRKGEFVLCTKDALDLQVLLSDLQNATVEFDPHAEAAVKPVRLKIAGGELILDWWLDVFRENTENLKCWAGQVTTGKLAEELLRTLPSRADAASLFYAGTMMKTKFGIDPRSAWSALDVGYSPNEHNQDTATFAAVEILGAIGLQGFRPLHRKREEVPYHMWHTPLARQPARRAAIEPWPGLTKTSMKFRIAKRGQSYKYFTFAEPKER